MECRRFIYVPFRGGVLLMPPQRKRHIQELLKLGKARVVEHVPFVVRLLYDTPGITQPLYGGTNLGRTSIGDAAIDGNGTAVYKDHLTPRNKETAKIMSARRGFCQRPAAVNAS